MRLQALTIALAATAFLIGFVLLIAGFTAGRRHQPATTVLYNRPMRPPGTPPPGWYPEPGSGRPRYWDRYRWQP